MRAAFVSLLFLGLSVSVTSQTRPGRTLDIYVIDVEGGEATLFVSPSGESMLVDAGWPGFDGRDADRIAWAAGQAGIKQIDHLIVSHFHGDHMGGVSQLAARFPIRQFIDHGSSVDQGERDKAAFQVYADARGKGTHQLAKPGDKIAVAGLNVDIIAADGATLRRPLSGAGRPNPFCAGFEFQGGDILKRTGDAEDSRSVSAFVTYGRFHTLIMGDLTWNKEHDLMCPNNQLGTVDLYLVSHHGSDTSGSKALVHALQPRVAIMNNGARKGGAVQTFQILRASPGLEDLWQNHYSIAGGQEHNRPEQFIANLEDTSTAAPAAAQGRQSAAPVHLSAAYAIKVSAQADGAFTVTNTRNGFTKTYQAAKN